jgi:hypothetical protein
VADKPYLPQDDQLLVDAVEQAVAPFDALLTEEQRAILRELLADGLATHPVTAELLDELRPRTPVERSGPEKKPGTEETAAESDDEAAEKRGAG